MESVEMVDGFGNWSHYPYAGGLMDQPARDMAIYTIARGKWIKAKGE